MPNNCPMAPKTFRQTHSLFFYYYNWSSLLFWNATSLVALLSNGLARSGPQQPGIDLCYLSAPISLPSQYPSSFLPSEHLSFHPSSRWSHTDSLLISPYSCQPLALGLVFLSILCSGIILGAFVYQWATHPNSVVTVLWPPSALTFTFTPLLATLLFPHHPELLLIIQ